MAASSEIEEWDKDSPMVRQGEVADRFYVVLNGQASVVVDGKKVNELPPRDQFGEIALFHGIPRTADVVASTPVVALSLARNDVPGPVRRRLALC